MRGGVVHHARGGHVGVGDPSGDQSVVPDPPAVRTRFATGTRTREGRFGGGPEACPQGGTGGGGGIRDGGRSRRRTGGHGGVAFRASRARVLVLVRVDGPALVATAASGPRGPGTNTSPGVIGTDGRPVGVLGAAAPRATGAPRVLHGPGVLPVTRGMVPVTGVT